MFDYSFENDFLQLLDNIAIGIFISVLTVALGVTLAFIVAGDSISSATVTSTPTGWSLAKLVPRIAVLAG